MFGWNRKKKSRRRQAHAKRLLSESALKGRRGLRLFSWPVLVTLLFIAGTSTIAMLGETALDYAIGQRVDQPIVAKVKFDVPNPAQTRADREAARASTPSIYVPTASSLTSDRIRADLQLLIQAAADAESFDEFQKAIPENKNWPLKESAYEALRKIAQAERGREVFKEWHEKDLSLKDTYVARGLLAEKRSPTSTTDYLVLVNPKDGEDVERERIPLNQVFRQENEGTLRGIARDLADTFERSAARRMIARPEVEDLKALVESVIVRVLKEQPTIVFDQERTVAAMQAAEADVPQARTIYEEGQPFIDAGVILGSENYELLKAHHEAYMTMLEGDESEAAALRMERWLQLVGLVALTSIVSIGLVLYAGTHQWRIFEIRARSLAFFGLVLATLLAARLIDMQWPELPEAMLAPSLLAASVLAIVYPRRFAVGAMCIVAVLATTIVRGNLPLLLTLFVGVAIAASQLEEIRSRTKIITSGVVTAIAVAIATAAGNLMSGYSVESLPRHTMWAGGSALLAAFLTSGLLPFIEKAFRIATSLTLLEWRDPTRPLLQLLAREAPGTYNHSLVLGTLAEAACERIGANGLLAQVGALYHDIGKIYKADYFVENQSGGINRHDNLAPTMSLLIILGHVKDGLELAKEYKLPRILHQFIAEHHGTTVVRYFHHMASEQQPRIASGRHDREVPEAEFRYPGPKARTRESAIVMLCDGVEGAVRSLNEPTVGRIESLVHQIVAARVNDGQLSDCDMTMREIRLVEESLVKSLCSIYHGRVAYPKASKPAEPPRTPAAGVSGAG